MSDYRDAISGATVAPDFAAIEADATARAAIPATVEKFNTLFAENDFINLSKFETLEQVLNAVGYVLSDYSKINKKLAAVELILERD